MMDANLIYNESFTQRIVNNIHDTETFTGFIKAHDNSIHLIQNLVRNTNKRELCIEYLDSIQTLHIDYFHPANFYMFMGIIWDLLANNKSIAKLELDKSINVNNFEKNIIHTLTYNYSLCSIILKASHNELPESISEYLKANQFIKNNSNISDETLKKYTSLTRRKYFIAQAKKALGRYNDALYLKLLSLKSTFEPCHNRIINQTYEDNYKKLISSVCEKSSHDENKLKALNLGWKNLKEQTLLDESNFYLLELLNDADYHLKKLSHQEEKTQELLHFKYKFLLLLQKNAILRKDFDYANKLCHQLLGLPFSNQEKDLIVDNLCETIQNFQSFIRKEKVVLPSDSSPIQPTLYKTALRFISTYNQVREDSGQNILKEYMPTRISS